jgi:hypothetical protein
MDGIVQSIAAASIALATQRVQVEAGTSMLRKSLDLASEQSASLLQSLPSLTGQTSTYLRLPHLGRNIDITA